LATVLGLTTAYKAVEADGGWLTNSLALLADAGHMFTDVAALGLALSAMWMCERDAPPEKTYGYHRLEILAALINSVALVVVALLIFYHAYERLLHPPEVKGLGMLVVAVGGLAVNIIGVWVLHGSHRHSLNVRGALLHVVSDGLGSLGAIIAAVLISVKGWYLADAATSFVTGGLIVVCSWRLLKETVNVLMEATPAHIDICSVEQAIRDVAGVSDVHDLHVWTITSGKEALSAHVILSDGSSHRDILKTLQMKLREDFGIEHVTIQLETPDFEEEKIHF
jgi:cobalt-zinc-cadmium efflux system protein